MNPTRSQLTNNAPLGQARAFVTEHKEDEGGCICPACGSLRKTKPYHLNPQLARMLRRLVQLSGPHRRAVHKNDWEASSSRMYSMLRHWGLIESATPEPPAPGKPFKKSGHWRPTKLALEWLRGEKVVSATVYVDLAQVLGFSPRRISFRDALRAPWNPESAYDSTVGVPMTNRASGRRQ